MAAGPAHALSHSAPKRSPVNPDTHSTTTVDCGGSVPEGVLGCQMPPFQKEMLKPCLYFNVSDEDTLYFRGGDGGAVWDPAGNRLESSLPMCRLCWVFCYSREYVVEDAGRRKLVRRHLHGREGVL